MGHVLEATLKILKYWLSAPEEEPGPRTEAEVRACKLGEDAYFSGWHQNPYARHSSLHQFWQAGHDNAEYLDFHAW